MHVFTGWCVTCWRHVLSWQDPHARRHARHELAGLGRVDAHLAGAGHRAQAQAAAARPRRHRGRVVRRLGRRRRAGRRVAAAVPEKENVVLNHKPCRKINTHCDKETVETAGRYEPVLALAPAPDLAL